MITPGHPGEQHGDHPQARGSRATPGGGSPALVAGSVGAGLAAYAFVVLGTRAYGSVAFSSVAQVWTIWFVGAAALTFPLQHWIIDTRTKDGDLIRVRRALPRIGATVTLAALGLGALSFAFDERLFASSSLSYPLAVAGVIFGAGLLGVLRGLLGGEGRRRAHGHPWPRSSAAWVAATSWPSRS